MGWTKNYVEEIDEAIIEILKSKHKELGLDAYCLFPEDLDDIVSPYYWMVDRLGDEIASVITRDAEQAVLERLGGI